MKFLSAMRALFLAAAYLEKCLSGAINETADLERYAVSLASIISNLPVLAAILSPDGCKIFGVTVLFGPDDQRYFRLINSSRICLPESFLAGIDGFALFRHSKFFFFSKFSTAAIYLP